MYVNIFFYGLLFGLFNTYKLAGSVSMGFILYGIYWLITYGLWSNISDMGCIVFLAVLFISVCEFMLGNTVFSVIYMAAISVILIFGLELIKKNTKIF